MLKVAATEVVKRKNMSNTGIISTLTNYMVAATSTTTLIPSDIPHITTSIVTVADAAIASSNNHYYDHNDHY